MKMCILRQDNQVLHGWIDERGAILGARVELKGEDGLWEVREVFEPSIDEKWLKDKQRKDRASLLSIKKEKA